MKTLHDYLVQQVQEDLGLTKFAEEHLNEEQQQELCDAVVNLLEREIVYQRVVAFIKWHNKQTQ